MMPRVFIFAVLLALFRFAGISSTQAEQSIGEQSVAVEQSSANTVPSSTEALNTASMHADPSEIDLLKMIEVTIAQQRSVTITLQDLQSKKVELETQLNKLTNGQLDEKPPYSILLMDRLNDSIASSKVKRESLEESRLAAREAVERARQDVDNRNRTLRQLKENNATEVDPKRISAEHEVRLADETLVLRRQELAIEEAAESVRALETRIDQQTREIISKQVVFAAEIIEEKNRELDARAVELKQKSDSLQRDLQYAERRWMAARQQVDSSPKPALELLQRAESLKIAQTTIRIAQGVNNQRIQRLPMMRTSWDRRYRVATGQSTRQERVEWLAETIVQLEQLSRERRSRELKLDETRATLSAIASKSDDGTSNGQEMKRWLNMATESLAEQSDLHNRAILGIDSGKRALSRLRVEIEGEPSRSIGEWIIDAWAAAKRFWNYELTNVQDTSLTVGRVFSCLLFVFFGYFAARFLSRLLGKRLPKIGVDDAAANAIESLTFYVLMIAFTLAALRYANVPLTAFTFLGGAIAIGVGFGSQNILNNFISGLILLAERPIKVGDLIFIDNTYGNVTQIGARSTQIRTGDNLDIIVPNSRFLENNVVNLTRTDDRLRTSIKIGVAYGSPLDEVMILLKQAATDNPNVHRHPEPFVWFEDFGDNSLEFQVNFWLSVRSVVQRKTVETDVRLSIDRLFRQHSISIAFPQRDLHLSTQSPIEFRMVREKEQASELRAAG